VTLRSFIALLLTLAAAPLQAAPVVVLTTGAASPLGLPFSSFSNVAMMADGRVAFFGSSAGTFRRTDAGVVDVVSAGDTLADGRQVAGVSPPALGPGDCVAVRAYLIGGGSRILRRCGDVVDTVVATGQLAPGGGTFAEFTAGVAYGVQGQIAFTAILDDGNTGLFLQAGSAGTSVARTGGSPSAGLVYTALRLLGVTADGRVGYRGSVSSAPDGLFISGRPQALVQVGEASPAGGTFRTVTGASMSDGGTFTFRADGSDGNAGVFRAFSTGVVPIETVVREGDDVGAGITIKSLPSSTVPSINATGAIAFRATLSGASGGSGIFVATPGSTLQQIVSAREQSDTGGKLVRLRDPAIADDGSVLVPASQTGTGPSLFVYRAGAITSLAKIGEATDIDTGLERFRFSTPNVRDAAERAVFAGSRDGLFIADSAGGLETVAFIGGPTPLGGTYAGFDPPAADAAGIVTFGADIGGSGIASRGLIMKDSRGVRAVARGSERVGGRNKLVDFFASSLDALTRADVGPKGEMVFEATLQGKTPRGLLYTRGGKPQLVVRANKAAPGGGSFDTFGTPAILRGKRMAFVAQAGPDANKKLKMFLDLGSRMRVLAAQGGGAPGRLTGRFAQFDPPDANNSLVAFRATLDEASHEGLDLAAPRAVGLLVGNQDPAPGGGTFRAFSALSLGGSQAVFQARLTGSPASAALYRVSAAAVPAADATAPAVQRLGAPGDPSPVGGTIDQFTAVESNRSDALAVVVDLVGASARTALVLVDASGTVVP
jgi:hypothetical protein